MLFSGRGYWYVAIVTLHFLHLTSHLSHIHISYCITLLTCYITPWSHVCIQCLEYISFTQNPGRAPPSSYSLSAPWSNIYSNYNGEQESAVKTQALAHLDNEDAHTCNTQIVAHTAQADVQWYVWAPRQWFFYYYFWICNVQCTIYVIYQPNMFTHMLYNCTYCHMTTKAISVHKYFQKKMALNSFMRQLGEEGCVEGARAECLHKS